MREAVPVLGISERQGWRLLVAYREEGARGLVHKNRDRVPPNATEYWFTTLPGNQGGASARIADAQFSACLPSGEISQSDALHNFGISLFKLRSFTRPRPAGRTPKIVQERLGHAKVGTTLDLGSHVVPGLEEATALKFEEVLMDARQPARTPERV